MGICLGYLSKAKRNYNVRLRTGLFLCLLVQVGKHNKHRLTSATNSGTTQRISEDRSIVLLTALIDLFTMSL